MSKQYEFDEMALPYGYTPMCVYPCMNDTRTDGNGETIIPSESQIQPTVTDFEYTQGYLKTKIGKRVKVDFLIGTNLYIDREGILTEVGISYIVLKNTITNISELCDIYSIKFVQFYN